MKKKKKQPQTKLFHTHLFGSFGDLSMLTVRVKEFWKSFPVLVTAFLEASFLFR